MQPRGARTLLTLCAALVSLLAWTGSAGAQIRWTPCGDTNDFACGHLTVPLDPADPAAGTLTLAMRRHLAAVGPARDAVVALAGGPGQAAIPFAEQFSHLLGPIAATRDLIVLDQRGTGLSHSLSCAAFERLAGREPTPGAVGVCSAQLGPSRAFYQTEDTVADIEAVRRAGDYERLVLYGTSYGTKVAERYAQSHPSNVEALVLDSVVTPDGPDPFSRSSFAAVPRVLRTLCAHAACARITRDPVGDLAGLVRRAARARGLPAREIDGHGRAERVRVSSEDLLDILYAGDFNPFLRAEFPAAVRSAVLGDPAALARMLQRAEGGEGEPESPAEGFDMPLFFSTTCEEEPFPWARSASPAARVREAAHSLRALGPQAFAPFTTANAFDSSPIRQCAHWSFSGPAPAPDRVPFPAVPTLILSGEADLRTPTANARQVAREIPGAQLLVVPGAGHSVLGSLGGACARRALQSFFAHHRIARCGGPFAASGPPLFPLAPRRVGDLAPARGSRGRAGRALQAVILTLEDFERQSELQFLANVPGVRSLLGLFELDVGGLRAGWARLDEERLALHDYTYVPGVSVSGRLLDGAGRLHVGGSRAARGTLRVNRHGQLAGTLDDRRVSARQPVRLP